MNLLTDSLPKLCASRWHSNRERRCSNKTSQSQVRFCRLFAHRESEVDKIAALFSASNYIPNTDRSHNVRSRAAACRHAIATAQSGGNQK